MVNSKMSRLWMALSYAIPTVFFIVGAMRLKSPKTARTGMWWIAMGMIVGVGGTVLLHPDIPWGLTIAVMAIGSGLGVFIAKRVKMTAMPQMVAVFNGMGGGGAALVALDSLGHFRSLGAFAALIATITLVIGSISFSGSSIAFLKLQEWLHGPRLSRTVQATMTGLGLLLLLSLVSLRIANQPVPGLAIWIMIAAVFEGVMLVIPIGGADMPVVISMLNALTGLAAAATGFLISNNVLIVAGALVGASGTILTQQMSRAMNRSLRHILFSSLAQSGTGTPGHGDLDGTMIEASHEDVAMLLTYSRNIIVVPGFGLAASRAQQEVRQLMEKLAGHQVGVKFAIHPVAGRMPGHMNVLLAEANIPYDRLFEMDAINQEFKDADVALVIGANDVTNPAAKTEPNSPLFGMPVLNVDQAKKVIVLKRGKNPGFSGVDNPLYTRSHTSMLFGDAKDSLGKLIQAIE